MIHPIPVRTLFAVSAPNPIKSLKSQRSALSIEDKQDYARALQFLIRLALVQQFETNVFSKVADAFKGDKDADLAQPQYSETAWSLFLGEGAARMQASGYEPGIASALDVLSKGAITLSTHIDKSSELPQKASVRESFFAGLGKSLKTAIPMADSYDARVFVHSVALGQGPAITMDDQTQAALGLVCSPKEPFYTSVGNAGDAALQQMLMIKMMPVGEQPFSLFDVMRRKDYQTIGLLLAEHWAPREADIEQWLADDVGDRAFMATLFVGINYLCTGEYAAHLEGLLKRMGRSFKGAPGSMIDRPEGRGLSMIRLPTADGSYHLATPLINTGLLREIHESRWTCAPEEETYQWSRLYTQIKVGGSKPQNAGSFFSAVMSNGTINGFDAPLSEQRSGLRVLRKKIREGRTMFLVTRARASEICSRKAQHDPSYANRKIHKLAKAALTRRVHVLAVEAVGLLASIRQLIDSQIISPVEFEQARRTSGANAEYKLITGTANDEDIKCYAKHLQQDLFRTTHMTRAEKYVVAKTLPSAISQLIKEA